MDGEIAHISLGRTERLELRVPPQLKKKLKVQAKKAQLSLTDYCIGILDDERNKSMPDLILAERATASFYRRMDDNLNVVIRQVANLEKSNITLDHIRYLVEAIDINADAVKKEVIKCR